MFKKLASDVMGLSDIGKIIDPKDYDKVDSDDYILHEEEEKIYFLIKSKTDEYCFTNAALIHLDGDSAVSSKRMLRRFAYKTHHFSHVLLETAGNIDLDVEIKFSLGDQKFSIDVDRKQIEKLKDLYKSLVKIASIQRKNDDKLAMSHQSLEAAIGSFKGTFGGNTTPETFAALNEYVYNWKSAKYDELLREDFGQVFEKFINN
ncbi:MAG: PH domain-containing protein [Cytophagales bacterium]|nr:PH domain-containing protein [Cytophagales bacterium]